MTENETKVIAEKLWFLVKEADAIDAPTWTSPSTRKEVAEAFKKLGPVLLEVQDLMDQYIRRHK